MNRPKTAPRGRVPTDGTSPDGSTKSARPRAHSAIPSDLDPNIPIGRMDASYRARDIDDHHSISASRSPADSITHSYPRTPTSRVVTAVVEPLSTSYSRTASSELFDHATSHATSECTPAISHLPLTRTLFGIQRERAILRSYSVTSHRYHVPELATHVCTTSPKGEIYGDLTRRQADPLQRQLFLSQYSARPRAHTRQVLTTWVLRSPYRRLSRTHGRTSYQAHDADDHLSTPCM